jgi:hypothetical protein
MRWKYWIREICLLAARLLMAVAVVYAMPISHMRWGNPYPGDGQGGFGVILGMAVIGGFAALVFVVAGTHMQTVLQKRAFWVTLISDVLLLLIFAGGLAYLGVTAEYQ